MSARQVPGRSRLRAIVVGLLGLAVLLVVAQTLLVAPNAYRIAALATVVGGVMAVVAWTPFARYADVWRPTFNAWGIGLLATVVTAFTGRYLVEDQVAWSIVLTGALIDAALLTAMVGALAPAASEILRRAVNNGLAAFVFWNGVIAAVFVFAAVLVLPNLFSLAEATGAGGALRALAVTILAGGYVGAVFGSGAAQKHRFAAVAVGIAFLVVLSTVTIQSALPDADGSMPAPALTGLGVLVLFAGGVLPALIASAAAGYIRTQDSRASAYAIAPWSAGAAWIVITIIFTGYLTLGLVPTVVTAPYAADLELVDGRWQIHETFSIDDQVLAQLTVPLDEAMRYDLIPPDLGQLRFATGSATPEALLVQVARSGRADEIQWRLVHEVGLGGTAATCLVAEECDRKQAALRELRLVELDHLLRYEGWQLARTVDDVRFYEPVVPREQPVTVPAISSEVSVVTLPSIEIGAQIIEPRGGSTVDIDTSAGLVATTFPLEESRSARLDSHGERVRVALAGDESGQVRIALVGWLLRNAAGHALYKAAQEPILPYALGGFILLVLGVLRDRVRTGVEHAVNWRPRRTRAGAVASRDDGGVEPLTSGAPPGQSSASSEH